MSVEPQFTQPAINNGNISSARLDQQEVTGIAEELKRDFMGGKTEDAPAGANGASEGVLHLQSTKGANEERVVDDTIVIDSDGKFQPM